MERKNTINIFLFYTVALFCFSFIHIDTALGTLYSFIENEETFYGKEEFSLIPMPLFNLEQGAGGPSEDENDLYDRESLGFKIDSEEGGFHSWELTYSDSSSDGRKKIEPTRTIGKWSMKTSPDGSGSVYLFFPKGKGSNAASGFLNRSTSGGGGSYLSGSFVEDFFNRNRGQQYGSGSPAPQGSTGEDKSDQAAQRIPEPATIILLGTGLLGILGLLFLRRRVTMPFSYL
ncbi:MAG: PEP-CTERM sorting domain-containing protein [Desulfobacteraceae bacterium]|jgi:hypothetical protein|nr:MAG: PEP-CTERM sorting domain-containing protein [Desulfobacteraceae bacterium]